MKKLLSVFLFLTVWLSASAYDFEVDGIYYNTIGNGQVEVTGITQYGGGYSGSVVIPSSVTYTDYYGETHTYSVTSIGNDAFYGCSGLTTVTIPNSVTSIGSFAFSGCSGLTSVTIPNSVTSIDSYAFQNCSSLTSVTIPNSVTSIGNYAFSFSGLTSVTIPNSVTSIGDYAFYYCTGLTTVTIPNSVTSIGDIAFYGCSNITDITCLATTPPTIKSNTFANYDATLYVPSGSISLYSAESYWMNFNIQPIPDISNTITVNSNDEQMGTTLGSGTYEENTNAQLVAVTQAGYSFQRWSDGNTDNPRNVVVTKDSTFTAYFADPASVHDTIIRIDTLIVRDTVYEVRYDTIYETLYDTVYITQTDTIYLEYDGKDAMQYSLEEQGVYYLGSKVYNSQNLYIKLYYSDGKLLSSGTNDIDMSSCPNGIYIVTDGKGGFLKINHYR